MKRITSTANKECLREEAFRRSLAMGQNNSPEAKHKNKLELMRKKKWRWCYYAMLLHCKYRVLERELALFFSFFSSFRVFGLVSLPFETFAPVRQSRFGLCTLGSEENVLHGPWIGLWLFMKSFRPKKYPFFFFFDKNVFIFFYIKITFSFKIPFQIIKILKDIFIKNKWFLKFKSEKGYIYKFGIAHPFNQVTKKINKIYF